MPIAEPETALPATIVARGDPTLIRDKIIRPAARAGPSTIFQSLAPRLNDLRRNASGGRSRVRPSRTCEARDALVRRTAPKPRRSVPPCNFPAAETSHLSPAGDEPARQKL